MQFPDSLNRYRLIAEEALSSYISNKQGAPESLKEAMQYSLLAGGKRLRPVTVLAVSDMFPHKGPNPLPAACAMEFIHTYSLIHDDLPALDNDDYRRGKLTSHKKFGEALAILAGDGLLTEAFCILSSSYLGSYDSQGIRVISEIAAAAGICGMVGGQVLDTVNVDPESSIESVENVHRLKTGALFRASVRTGAILGGAGKDEIDSLTRYADKVGLAFQVVDDILDVTSSIETLGKSTGKDAMQKKTTYVTAMGLEKSRDYAKKLINGAIDDLKGFGEAADPLRELAIFTLERNS